MTRRKSLEKQRGPPAGGPAAEQPQQVSQMSHAGAPNGELVVVCAPERFHKAGMPAARAGARDPPASRHSFHCWADESARSIDRVLCSSP